MRASQALRHADIADDDELKAQTLDTFWPYVLADEGMDALRVHVASLRVHGEALPFSAIRLAELFDLRPLAAVERLRLTDRERVILRATAEFSSMRKIAEHLMVSANTVKSQQRSLYRKLGVKGRDEAVSKARQLGHLLS